MKKTSIVLAESLLSQKVLMMCNRKSASFRSFYGLQLRELSRLLCPTLPGKFPHDDFIFYLARGMYAQGSVLSIKNLGRDCEGAVEKAQSSAQNG